MKKVSILLMFTFAFILNAIGQPDKAVVEPIKMIVKTNDDNTIIGTIDRENKNYIWLDTEDYGIIQIKKSNISSRELLKSDATVKEGKVWFENPNATRNLYGPTGYGLKKGEGYYQNFLLFFNSVSYGFTDNFTLEVGTIPIAGSFNITPKFSFPIVENKWNAGLGVLCARVLDYDLGIGYGVLTYGDKNTNLTAGIGYGFQEGELSDLPILTLSGMARVSERFSFVTENWFINTPDEGYQAYVSFSGRYMFDRISIDFGFVNPVELGLTIGIPVVGIVFPFRRK